MEGVETAYFNSTRTQVIYKRHKYQRKWCGKSSDWYKCIVKSCKASIKIANSVVVPNDSKDHDHRAMEKCQVAVEVALDRLVQNAVDDPQLGIRTAYDNLLNELKIVYGLKRVSQYWKNWQSVMRKINSKRQNMNPKSYDSSSIIDNDIIEIQFNKHRPSLNNKDRFCRCFLFFFACFVFRRFYFCIFI